jgi:hypothetical protein
MPRLSHRCRYGYHEKCAQPEECPCSCHQPAEDLTPAVMD